MLLQLLNIRNVNWWRVSSFGLVAAILLLFLFVRLQRIELQRAQVAFQNPLIMVQTRYVRVKGPIREVTKTVIKPGETVILREYVEGPTVYIKEGLKLEKPLVDSLANRPKRWFIGGGVSGLGSTEKSGLVYGGVTLFNTIDLGASVGTDSKVTVLGAYRF